MKKFYQLLIITILLAFQSFAQVDLIKDINEITSISSSNPSSSLTVNGVTFFSAAGGDGIELWKTDGTADGTVQVKDILQGFGSSKPGDFVDLNGILYFSANDNINGLELWKSDGTSEGTVIVKDINESGDGLYRPYFTVVGNEIFFIANDGLTGHELWKTDGTAVGTVLVKEIITGTSGTNISGLQKGNGILYFIANDGINGSELWRSDGTSAGTYLIKDIYAGAGSPSIGFLTEFAGELFFRANDGINGYELWKSDGTPEGTVIFKDIFSGSSSSYPSYLIEVNGNLYFNASNGINVNKLWKTDGTSEGTVLVRELEDGNHIKPELLTKVGNLLYFRSYNVNGYQIWKSDGTEAGTTVVKDNSTDSYFIHNMIGVNGLLFFTFNDAIYGTELWKSDGTSAGTVVVKDINPGDLHSSPMSLSAINGDLYFSADNELGRELWKSNGTSEGTVLIKDIKQGNNSSAPKEFIQFGMATFFTANDGVDGAELWKTDGTSEGTVQVKDIYPGSTSSSPRNFIEFNGYMYFIATDDIHGEELWKSDGTGEGTVLVKDVVTGINGSGIYSLEVINNLLFFIAVDAESNHGLYISDGTAEGTIEVKNDFGVSGYYSSKFNPPIYNLTNLNGELFFTVSVTTDIKKTQLWKSDGTYAGTVLVKDNFHSSYSKSKSSNFIYELIKIDNILYFSADDGTSGFELWRSDGTTEGTILLKDISEGAGQSNPNGLTNLNGTLYFSANGVEGAELWRSDGTSEGTVIIKDIYPEFHSSPQQLTSVNKSIYFTAVDPVLGRTLFKSDGTEAGTMVVKEQYLSAGGTFSDFKDINGILYFLFDDYQMKTLWKSTGKDCGTLLIAENPDVNILAYFSFEGKLLISGANKSIGTELYIHDTSLDIQIAEECKQEQFITFDPIPEKIYGDITFTANASVNSPLEITYTSSDPSVAIINENEINILNSGSAIITAKQAGNLNFAAAVDVEQILTITKAPLTATADNQTRTYGAADPKFTISYSGFVNGDDITAITEPTPGTTATTTSDVGTYPIALTGGSAANYSLSLIDGTLTITQAMLTVTADDKIMIYGDAQPALTQTITGFVNTDDETVLDVVPQLSTTVTATSNAGVYTISSLGGSDLNYSFTYTDGALTINKAALTATADNHSKVYGEANPALTFVYSGFVNGEDATVLDTPPVTNTTADATTGAGAYPIIFTAGADNNYEITTVDGLLTVTKAPLTATADDKTRTYGAADPVFTISYTGFVNGDDATAITEPTTGTITTITSDVGTYPIALTGGSADNYDLTLVDGTLSITSVDLSVTADDQSIIYGDALPALTQTITGFVNGEDETVLDVVPTISTTATATSDAGVYITSSSGGSDINYTFTYTDGALTINKAALTATADDQTKVYGEANPALTFIYSGFVNGEDETVLDTPPVTTTTADVTSGAGTYPITFTAGTDINYEITTVDGILTVTKAQLTATADDITRTYGTANPELTISYTGFLNGDDAAAITEPSISTGATISSAVGNYNIVLSGGSSDNYNLSLVDGLLTITEAVLTVTAHDETITYGDNIPALSQSITGFVNDDTESVIDIIPVLTTTATNISNAGSYAITSSDGADDNYLFNYVEGSLLIEKAPLSVIADDKDRIYGEENPPLTITFNGFVNGEDTSVLDIVPTASTEATAGSNAGTYAILLSNAADNNYEITMTAGVLTVNKADQTITFEALPQEVSEDLGELDLLAEASSGLAVTFTSSDYAVAAVETNVLQILGFGEIIVSANQEGNINYNAAVPVSQTIVITEVVGLMKDEIEEINIHPNPTSDFFRINASDNSIQNIYLVNMEGIVVKEYNTLQSEYIIDSVANGIYFVIIEGTDGETKIGKLMIMK